MIQMCISRPNPKQLGVMIRALHSFTPEQVDAVLDRLGLASDQWTVDQHADYDGNMSILTTHEITGTIFLISGTAKHIDVAELRDDKLHWVGQFDKMDAALACLAAQGLGRSATIVG